jgi:hypothetical protein
VSEYSEYSEYGEHTAAPAVPYAPTPITAPAPAPAPAPRGPGARGIALLACGALLAVAALGSAAYAAVHGGGGGGHTAAWQAPRPQRSGSYGSLSGGTHYGKLTKLLLPVPAGFVAGPDDGQYGNDAQLDAARATAVLESPYASLPSAERAAMRRGVAAMHVEGLGLRTYQASDGSAVAEVVLVQMRNQAAAKAGVAYFHTVTGHNAALRKGPAVHGHTGAYCAVPKKKVSRRRLTAMTCAAAEGDLMVTLSVNGPAPLPTTTYATLLQHQLDRVQDPGEAA